jgi:hypothetical protein
VPAAEERVIRPFVNHPAIAHVTSSFGLDLPLCFDAVAVKVKIHALAPGKREQGREEKRIASLAQDQVRVGVLDQFIECMDDADGAGEMKNARRVVPLDKDAAPRG